MLFTYMTRFDARRSSSIRSNMCADAREDPLQVAASLQARNRENCCEHKQRNCSDIALVCAHVRYKPAVV